MNNKYVSDWVQNIAKWFALLFGIIFFVFENLDENYQWISWSIPYKIKPDPLFLWRLWALPTLLGCVVSAVLSLPKWPSILAIFFLGLVFLRIIAFH